MVGNKDKFVDVCNQLIQLKAELKNTLKKIIIELLEEHDGYIDTPHIMLSDTPIDVDRYVIYALELNMNTNNIIVHIKNEYDETTMSFDGLDSHEIQTLGFSIIIKYNVI
jgi:hypothetical protein